MPNPYLFITTFSLSFLFIFCFFFYLMDDWTWFSNNNNLKIYWIFITWYYYYYSSNVYTWSCSCVGLGSGPIIPPPKPVGLSTFMLTCQVRYMTSPLLVVVIDVDSAVQTNLGRWRPSENYYSINFIKIKGKIRRWKAARIGTRGEQKRCFGQRVILPFSAKFTWLCR